MEGLIIFGAVIAYIVYKTYQSTHIAHMNGMTLEQWGRRNGESGADTEKYMGE